MDRDQPRNESSRYFDERAQRYVGEASWITDAELIRQVVDPVPAGGRVLDVCAGPGILANACLSYGAHVSVALDMSMGMLLQAPAAVHRVCADATALPFRDDSFDLVVCRQGLHYVRDVGASIREMGRVGGAWLHVANVAMWDPEDLPFWQEYAHLVTPARTKYFCPGELADAVASEGLRVVRAQHFANRTELRRSLLALPKTKQNEVVRLFAQQPSRIRRAYDIDYSATDVHYTVRWEVVVARCFSSVMVRSPL